MIEYEQELIKKHDIFCRVSSQNTNVSMFTKDEQITRYTTALAFWLIEEKLLENQLWNVEKLTFVTEKKSLLLNRINQIFGNDLKILIQAKAKEITNLNITTATIAETNFKLRIIEVNKNIINLIRSNETKWNNQIGNLKYLLRLHLNFLSNNDLDYPTIETLKQLESIKMWRTDNLNKKENLNDDRYGKNIVIEMCKVKIDIMAIV